VETDLKHHDELMVSIIIMEC